ncbi:beta-1,3-galactosyltransferase 1 [Plakobranchus ocellatus]|uniref:Beta-1,3-galactosyltransferase 1 n=1 Tax=Plakobranchus ocellatus TaxID=259542 RepID=A0AAV4D2N5_9GAST|nr:beta-1,3-galactosyltransferase 1 [Plakobranchus ocellatus]
MSPFQLASTQGKIWTRFSSIRLSASFTSHRRRCRRLLILMALLIVLTLAVKLQNMIFYLTLEHGASNIQDGRGALNKVAKAALTEELYKEQRKGQVYDNSPIYNEETAPDTVRKALDTEGRARDIERGASDNVGRALDIKESALDPEIRISDIEGRAPDTMGRALGTRGRAFDAGIGKPDTDGRALDIEDSLPDNEGRAPVNVGRALDLEEKAPNIMGKAHDIERSAPDAEGRAIDIEERAFAQLGIQLVSIPIGDDSKGNYSSKHLRIEKVNSAEALKEKIQKMRSNLLNVAKTRAGISRGFRIFSESSDQNLYFRNLTRENSVDYDTKVNAKQMTVLADGRAEVQNVPKGSDAVTDILPVSLTLQQQSKYPWPHLAILIVSRPNNVLFRQATRHTWARDASDYGTTVRFIVGRDEHWDEVVSREQKMHGDLIVMDEDDVYDLLPTKVLEGLTWALRQETGIDYVMKADDDTIVNLPYLLEELYAGVINSTQILGAICKNVSVVRDPSDRWAVNLLDYPLDTYPIYAAGGGYVMSTQAASAIVKVRSHILGWIHLEDVYITGILAAKAKLGHIFHPGFSYRSDTQAEPCDFIQKRRLTSLEHTDKEITEMYANLNAMLNAGGVRACADRTNSKPSETR